MTRTSAPGWGLAIGARGTTRLGRVRLGDEPCKGDAQGVTDGHVPRGVAPPAGASQFAGTGSVETRTRTKESLKRSTSASETMADTRNQANSPSRHSPAEDPP